MTTTATAAANTAAHSHCARVTGRPVILAPLHMGAYVLGLFGDVATELGIRADGDEGLFASYSDVQFVSEVRGGDLVEARATIVRVGRRSREIEFEARIVARSTPEVSASAAAVLDPPLVCTTARGTVVVP